MALPDWLDGLRRQIAALSPGRRIALAVCAAASLAFFLWLALGAGADPYRLLYRGLAEDEAAEVVDALRDRNVPYRLRDGGAAVYVPAGQVYEARIRLAGEGLPSGGGAGFELFDRPSFGVTDFVHRVNYQRAVQGELARSVEQLDPVARARVQIAVPERSPFVNERTPEPSASIVLRVRPGFSLTAPQVRGIVHLASASVQGLSPENVTVVDDRGRLLAPDGEGSLGPEAPAATRSYQARLESELADRIETILEPTLGRGRVVARVHADLDWTQRESTEERFDPDSQIERSEQRTTETSSEGGAGAAGVPGVRSNLPNAGAPAGRGSDGSGAASTRTVETINYEISKTVNHSVSELGQIERLSVAVLVDGEPDAESGGFQPWAEESLREFESLARQAVGFSEERGDRITITTAPFRSLEVGEPAGGGWVPGPESLLLLEQLLRVLALIAGILLFARFVVRPLLAALRSDEPTPVAVPAGELELRLASAGRETPQLAPASPGAVEDLAALARDRADESVRALRTWLRKG